MKVKFHHFACLTIITASSLFSCKKSVSTDQISKDLKIVERFKSDTNFISRDSALLLAKLIQNESSFNGKGRRVNGLKSVENNTPETFTIYDKVNVPAAYAINYAGTGFAVLSADKRFPAVMAFSDNGHLDTSKVPLGFNRWLTVMRDSINVIRYAQANTGTAPGGGSPVYSTDPNLGTLVESIDPILQSYWGQGSGFNDNCPVKNCSNTGNGKALAGCVAIAIGQVMYKHQYPASYNWSGMSYYSGTPEAARLIRDIGINVGMDYGCDGSGADGDKTVNCFNAYNYNIKSVDYDPEWGTSAPIVQNLKQGKPFILTGGKQGKTWLVFNTYDDGHEWVCDGYKQYKKLGKMPVGNPRDGFHLETVTRYYNYYHMNWGWYGSYNGYFMFGNFVPGAPNIEGSPNANLNFSFNYKVKIFYDISPRI